VVDSGWPTRAKRKTGISPAFATNPTSPAGSYPAWARANRWEACVAPGPRRPVPAIRQGGCWPACGEAGASLRATGRIVRSLWDARPGPTQTCGIIPMSQWGRLARPVRSSWAVGVWAARRRQHRELTSDYTLPCLGPGIPRTAAPLLHGRFRISDRQPSEVQEESRRLDVRPFCPVAGIRMSAAQRPPVARWFACDHPPARRAPG